MYLVTVGSDTIPFFNISGIVKCHSAVWERFSKFNVKKKGPDGIEVKELRDLESICI